MCTGEIHSTSLKLCNLTWLKNKSVLFCRMFPKGNVSQWSSFNKITLGTDTSGLYSKEQYYIEFKLTVWYQR